MSVTPACRFSSSLFRLFRKRSPDNLAGLFYLKNTERMFTSQRFVLNQEKSDIFDKEKDRQAMKRQILGRMDRKLKLSFTCKKCSSRNIKIISKLSYEKGIVIVRCDGCKNNHLIADHLGWFPDLNKKLDNLDHLLHTKAKEIERVPNNTDVCFEAIPKDLMNDYEADETMGDLMTKIKIISEELKKGKNIDERDQDKELKNNENADSKYGNFSS